MLLHVDNLYLSQVHPDDIKWERTIFEKNKKGEYLPDFIPLYTYSNRNKEFINEHLVQKLLQYLCKYNIFKKENFISYFDILITNPLSFQLDLNEIKRAVDNKEANSPLCKLSESELSDIIERQIDWCLNKKNGFKKIKMFSPLTYIEMQGIKEVNLIKDENLSVKIRKWTRRERAIFSSQYSSLFASKKQAEPAEASMQVYFQPKKIL